MTKITNATNPLTESGFKTPEGDFNYWAEIAKADFQANVSSLLELDTHLCNKLQTSLEKKQRGVFLLNEEVKGIKEWLLEIISGLLANYTLVDRTNRVTNKLFRASLKIAEHRSAGDHKNPAV